MNKKGYKFHKYECLYCGNKFEACSGRQDAKSFEIAKNGVQCPHCKNFLKNKM